REEARYYRMSKLDLEQYGISVKQIVRNGAPAKLYEDALHFDVGTAVAESGALIVKSGEKTGRSPKEKRIVTNPESENDIWWGDINIGLDEKTFLINRERAIDYLNTLERLYVFDGFAGWDARHRLKVRIICSRPYHAL